MVPVRVVRGLVRAAHAAHASGAALSRRISLFVVIQQLIGCQITTIMGRAAVPLGQIG
jgi:hypothetical protein